VSSAKVCFVRWRGSDADAISSRLDVAGFRCLDGEILMGDVKNGYQATPNVADKRRP